MPPIHSTLTYNSTLFFTLHTKMKLQTQSLPRQRSPRLNGMHPCSCYVDQFLSFFFRFRRQKHFVLYCGVLLYSTSSLQRNSLQPRTLHLAECALICLFEYIVQLLPRFQYIDDVLPRHVCLSWGIVSVDDKQKQ